MNVSPTPKPATERTEAAPTPSARPRLRTCVGCGEPAPMEALVRVVVGPEGVEGLPVAVDLAGGAGGTGVDGRGAHLHFARECMRKACRSGFARAFKRKLVVDEGAFAEHVGEVADRRMRGLVAGAHRAGHLALGADATREALSENRAALVIVAVDAGAIAASLEIQRAIDGGMAVAWSDKSTLGALFGRDSIAVLAVLHDGLAAELRRVREVSAALAAARSDSAWMSPEDR